MCCALLEKLPAKQSGGSESSSLSGEGKGLFACFVLGGLGLGLVCVGFFYF